MSLDGKPELSLSRLHTAKVARDSMRGRACTSTLEMHQKTRWLHGTYSWVRACDASHTSQQSGITQLSPIARPRQADEEAITATDSLTSSLEGAAHPQNALDDATKGGGQRICPPQPLHAREDDLPTRPSRCFCQSSCEQQQTAPSQRAALSTYASSLAELAREPERSAGKEEEGAEQQLSDHSSQNCPPLPVHARSSATVAPYRIMELEEQLDYWRKRALYTAGDALRRESLLQRRWEHNFSAAREKSEALVRKLLDRQRRLVKLLKSATRRPLPMPAAGRARKTPSTPSSPSPVDRFSEVERRRRPSDAIATGHLMRSEGKCARDTLTASTYEEDDEGSSFAGDAPQTELDSSSDSSPHTRGHLSLLQEALMPEQQLQQTLARPTKGTEHDAASLCLRTRWGEEGSSSVAQHEKVAEALSRVLSAQLCQVLCRLRDCLLHSEALRESCASLNHRCRGDAAPAAARGEHRMTRRGRECHAVMDELLRDFVADSHEGEPVGVVVWGQRLRKLQEVVECLDVELMSCVDAADLVVPEAVLAPPEQHTQSRQMKDLQMRLDSALASLAAERRRVAAVTADLERAKEKRSSLSAPPMLSTETPLAGLQRGYDTSAKRDVPICSSELGGMGPLLFTRKSNDLHPSLTLRGRRSTSDASATSAMASIPAVAGTTAPSTSRTLEALLAETSFSSPCGVGEVPRGSPATRAMTANATPANSSHLLCCSPLSYLPPRQTRLDSVLHSALPVRVVQPSALASPAHSLEAVELEEQREVLLQRTPTEEGVENVKAVAGASTAGNARDDASVADGPHHPPRVADPLTITTSHTSGGESPRTKMQMWETKFNAFLRDVG